MLRAPLRNIISQIQIRGYADKGLFLGRLPKNTTFQELEEIFAEDLKNGNIIELSKVYNNPSNNRRAFCFITPNDNQSDYIIKKYNRAPFKDDFLNISE